MPSRFNLPHIDIIAFATSQGYVGEQGGGSGAVRERAAHGQRVQNELRVALAAADAVKPTDTRLEPPTGTFVEVELKRGTPPDVLDMKTQDIRTGAVKTTEANDRVIALYIPDHAPPVLEEILNDYLSGPLSKVGNNPPNKKKVESIEAIRTAQFRRKGVDSGRAPYLAIGGHRSECYRLR